MSDERVQAATGMIYVRNYRESWVTRAADLDIGMSCVMMRASRSMLGALETTSGALAIYRSSLIYDHLEAYSVECGTGDDRWLALRALQRGEVVGVAEACVETDMPATLKGTYRQRLRWARSWWWMLPFVFSNLRLKALISPSLGMLQLVIAPIIWLWIIGASIENFSDRVSQWAVVLIFIGEYLVVRYGLGALYVFSRQGVPARQRWLSWLLGTTLSIVLNLLLLTPTRYYALLKLKDNRWRTRDLSVMKGV